MKDQGGNSGTRNEAESWQKKINREKQREREQETE